MPDVEILLHVRRPENRPRTSSRTERPLPVPEEQPRRLQGDTAEPGAPTRSPQAEQAPGEAAGTAAPQSVKEDDKCT